MAQGYTQIYSAPAGTASGDLSGTYPAPTVAKINGVALGTTTATLGNVLTGNGTQWVSSSPVCVQRVSAINTAASTGVTLIPVDDTIPQNTEGDQYMSLSITPKNTANVLVIDIIANFASSVGGKLTAALFQDSTANALAAVAKPSSNSQNHVIKYVMTAGTTSSTTFKVRCGNNSVGTTTFNGETATRQFGGVNTSIIMITEYNS